MNDDFKECCFKIREALQRHEADVRGLMDHNDLASRDPKVSGEMRANVMLAFRHLEDCRMRLGKAVQAFDGGTSIYPR